MNFYLLIFSITIFLLGCKDSNNENIHKNIAATVNGVKIYQEEVNTVFNRTNIPTESEEDSSNRKKLILNNIIRSELMAQIAISEKLESNIDIELEVRMARRQILSSITEKNATKNIHPILRSEAKNIADSNREIYAKHQLLVIEEIQFLTNNEALFNILDASSSKGEGLDRLEKIALAEKSKINRSLKLIGTEQLPQKILKSLLAAKIGSATIVKFSKNKGSIIVVKSIINSPVSSDDAENIVINDLLNKQKQEVVSRLYRKKFNDSSIKYFGEFDTNLTQPNSLLLEVSGSSENDDIYKKISKVILTATGGLILCFMMLSYSFAKRWIFGDLWIPRLIFWKPQAFVETNLVHPEILPKFGSKVLFLVFTGCSFFTIFIFFNGFISKLPIWILAISIAFGVVLGTFIIQISSKSFIRTLSRTTRWWPPYLFVIMTWVISTTGLFIQWYL